MKTCVALLAAALLLCAAFCPAKAGPAGPDTSPRCSRHHQHRIRRNQVQGFYSTSSWCSLPSVVFVLKNSRQVCTDPQAPWVQALQAALGQK